LNAVIFNLNRMPDWEGIVPEITLLFFAILVIVLDLFIARKSILTIVSIVGILLCGLFSWSFWGTGLSFFNKMIAVDSFAVFFKLFFLGVALLLILASTDYISKFKRFQGE
jgi:NADH-quinone oxidoreductase subunit N